MNLTKAQVKWLLEFLLAMQWTDREREPTRSRWIHPACPECHGIEDTHGARRDFVARMIGHRRRCKLKGMLTLLGHSDG